MHVGAGLLESGATDLTTLLSAPPRPVHDIVAAMVRTATVSV